MKHHHHTDDIYKGALLVTIGVFFISTQSALAKWLGDTYHPVELVFYRNFSLLIMMGLYFQATGSWERVKTKRLPSHISRALVGTIGLILFIWSLNYLELPEATTIAFTTPLFVVLLSYPLLKEKIGPWRFLAVIIGFFGVLLISPFDPSNIVLIGVLLALAASFFNALIQILLRDLGKTEHTTTTVFHFMCWGTLATALILPFIWTGPKISDLIIIAGMCVAGAIQQIIKTKGYALAPVIITGPLYYTSIIWATVLAFALWNYIPTWQTILGATIIIASNLFIIWREQKVKNEKPNT